MSSKIRTLITTVEEWEAAKHAADRSKDTAILQIGAEWCKHCQPVDDAFQTFFKTYKFSFFYSDAADSERTDHFQCRMLPSVIIYLPASKETKMNQSMREEKVEEVLKTYCFPILVMDDDF